jgi:hypothetical protein
MPSRATSAFGCLRLFAGPFEGDIEVREALFVGQFIGSGHDIFDLRQLGQVTDAGVGLHYQGEIAGLGQPSGDVLDVFMCTPDFGDDQYRGEFARTLRGRKVNGDGGAIAGRDLGVADLQAIGGGHDHRLGADGPDGKGDASGRSGHEKLPAGLWRIGWGVHSVARRVHECDGQFNTEPLGHSPRHSARGLEP